MADDSVGRRMPFAFLSALQQAFTSAYTPAIIFDVPAYGLNEFSTQIGALMHEYSTNPPVDPLAQTQNELNQVRDIMVHNVEQILSRGERIELLVDKTDSLSGQAWAFKRGARDVRRREFWKNQRILALSIFVGLVRSSFFISPIVNLRDRFSYLATYSSSSTSSSRNSAVLDSTTAEAEPSLLIAV